MDKQVYIDTKINHNRADMLIELLNAYQLSFESVYCITDIVTGAVVIDIQIDDGDWKHEHKRCIDLVTTHFNLIHLESNKLGDSDQDTYSAVHRFKVKDYR